MNKENAIKKLKQLKSNYFCNYSYIPDDELAFIDLLGVDIDVDLLEYVCYSDDIFRVFDEYERLKINIDYFTDLKPDDHYMKLCKKELKEFDDFVSKNDLDEENDFFTFNGYGYYMKLTRFDLLGFVDMLIDKLENEKIIVENNQYILTY